jgi:hypothetical protein
LTKTDKRIGGEGELTIVQKGYLQREAGIELGLLMSEEFDVNKAGEDGVEYFKNEFKMGMARAIPFFNTAILLFEWQKRYRIHRHIIFMQLKMEVIIT